MIDRQWTGLTLLVDAELVQGYSFEGYLLSLDGFLPGTLNLNNVTSANLDAWVPDVCVIGVEV